MLLSILLFAGTMILSLWAAARVKSVYHRYSQVPAASGATGATTPNAIDGDSRDKTANARSIFMDMASPSSSDYCTARAHAHHEPSGRSKALKCPSAK